MGGVYLAQADNVSTNYVSYRNLKTKRLLLDSERADAIFFGSILEFKAWEQLDKAINSLSARYSDYKFVLRRQVPVPVFESNKAFPKPMLHKIDFALEFYKVAATGLSNYCPYRIIYIEAKGMITKDSLWIMRALEDKYQWLSRQDYLMVFDSIPAKFPRGYPRVISLETKNLHQYLNNNWITKNESP